MKFEDFSKFKCKFITKAYRNISAPFRPQEKIFRVETHILVK